MDDLLDQLGTRLKAQRLAKGFSLESLAAASGVSRSMISDIERSSKMPTVLVLARLATALGVTVSRLIGEDQNQPTITDATGWQRQILSPNLHLLHRHASDPLGEAMIQPLNPAVLPEATGTYTHGTLVAGVRRTVFVSGQVPWGNEDGKVPEDFDSQCRLTWRNVLAVLAEAGMGVKNLAKVTIYLSDREYRKANGRIRDEFLGDHRPALTIIITGIYAEEWLLEIEAIAVD